MSNYNIEREKKYIEYKLKQDINTAKEIEKMYKSTMDEINSIMNMWIGKYADENGISYEEAMKKIDKTDVLALEEKAKKYVAERNFSDKANEELRRYNLKMRMSRADHLKNEIALELIALGDKEEKYIRDKIVEEYLEEVTRQAGILGLSENVRNSLINGVNRVIDSSYKSVSWSERLWINNDNLRHRVQMGINRSMLQGKNPKTWASTLKNHLKADMQRKSGKENATFIAERLAVTETGRVQIEAQVESYKRGGFKYLQIIREPGACDECLSKEEIIKIDNVVQGDNVPMFHPFCRCSTVAYEE